MGYTTRIIEETEHGDGKTTVVKVVQPHIVEYDDYQSILSIAVEAIRRAVNGGRKGNFGVTFIVDANKNTVKRAESFYTESVTKLSK